MSLAAFLPLIMAQGLISRGSVGPVDRAEGLEEIMFEPVESYAIENRASVTGMAGTWNDTPPRPIFAPTRPTNNKAKPEKKAARKRQQEARRRNRR